jgi:hypothetical protein
MLRGVAAGALVAVVAAASCTTSAPPPEVPAASGPATIRLAAVRAHSRQFDEDDPRRHAGSQGEGIAATYILGHLQQAGYEVYLDPVPVRNLVNSTNVIALPPRGEEPEAVVVVAYDTAPGVPDTSAALGLFLELARAAHVRDGDAALQFAALGAERADVSGGRLGSRRLVQFMRERDQRPVVVSLEDISLASRGPVTVRGADAAEVTRSAREEGIATRIEEEATPTVEVAQAAGFRALAVGGPARAAGRLLLSYLTAGGSSP